ncbi:MULTISPECIES: GNAT family N-acetyltransferase [Nocardiopsidaceae]|uniref:GNAT family protein n=1 Tax=Streptomonospora nanhaiensis TaxID=1323731 RepID=A0ABY6YM44_9ACTN|nr:GNAT family protein [Streptomonospora nanhaiensis]WAE73439.1 GNAT family protein [Streptomonospora nanhaiensis]
MLTPHLETPRVRFSPIAPENVTKLYDLLTELGLESLPSRDAFSESYHSVAKRFVDVFEIQLRRTGEVLGFGSIREHDPAGHVKLGIFMRADRLPVGVGAESMMLLVNHAFANWDYLRKVYVLTTDASLGQFGSALLATPREASLPRHVYFQGRLWDLHFYSVSRSAWTANGAPILNRIARGPRSRAAAGGSRPE